MLLRYCLLVLMLTGGSHGQEFCNFQTDLCNWSNVLPCKFKHIKNSALVGEKDYLILERNSCKKAAIAFTKIGYINAFKMHYFMNGTGELSLEVKADYVMAGTRHAWMCKTPRGPKWNDAEILIKDGVFDQLKSITIEAIVDGDGSIAIGNIGPRTDDRRDISCLAIPAPKGLDTTNRTTKKQLAEERLLVTEASNEEIYSRTSLKQDDSSMTSRPPKSKAIATNNITKVSISTTKVQSVPSKSNIPNRSRTNQEAIEDTILHAYSMDDHQKTNQTIDIDTVLKELEKMKNLTLSAWLDNISDDDSEKTRFPFNSLFKWSVIGGGFLFAVLLLAFLITFSVLRYRNKREIRRI